MAANTELSVQITKAGEVTTNLAVLKAEIEALLQDYRGLEVTADYVPHAKRDRAYLNNLAKSIDDQRRNVKREFLKPLDEFEAAVKEVLEPIKEASTHIDVQVKAFEQRVKDDKREQIKQHWLGCGGILADVIDFERQVFDEKWLNASVSLGVATGAIDKLIEKVALDEAALSEMALPHQEEAKAAYFATLDLGAAILRSKELEEQRARVERFEADKAEILAALTPEPLPEVETVPEPPAAVPPVAREDLYRWEMRVVAATEAHMRQIADFAATLGVKGTLNRRERIDW